MTSPITIIDYGMGNLRSVQKAIERIGVSAKIESSAVRISQADRLILPGVGAFRDAIAALRTKDLVTVIQDHVAANRHFLGICLGLQLMFDVSFEDGEYEGLGIIPGEVRRFNLSTDYKIPHMGWNQLRTVQETPLLTGCPKNPWFYFVHSYHVVPADNSWIVTTTEYGCDFVSMVGRGNIAAAQFHPEKSQSTGIRLLSNFVQPEPLTTSAAAYHTEN
ncbi:MAG: imidazole glycerol phosphate synthase subunit HisH [Fuerstiella sp.]|nr:imidazole glycerol phosphate synthase subunit HisH [Fuerstiella sp.]